MNHDDEVTGAAAQARNVLAAAAIMVGTLLDAHPDKREWVEGCVVRQGGTFPGAEALQLASEAILAEVDRPMSVVAKLDAQGLPEALRLLDEFDRYASIPGSEDYNGSPFQREVRAFLAGREYPVTNDRRAG